MRKTNIQKAVEWGTSYGEAWAKMSLKRAETEGWQLCANINEIRNMLANANSPTFLAENEYPVFILRAKNDAVRKAADAAAWDAAEDVLLEAVNG